MRKLTIAMSMLLTLGSFCACSSDDGMNGFGNGVTLLMPEDGEEDIDSIYQITYYNQYPDLNIKLGYWIQNDFLELFPQSTPPYNLLVQWSDEQGKKVIDHILEENSKVMTKEDYTVTNNEYRIISDIYFESPHLYVSSYYKSSEANSYSTVILPQIIITMEEGKSVEAIKMDYNDVLTLKEDLNNLGIYIFDCNLKTSWAILELVAEIYQRDDVRSSCFNTYGEYY